MSYFPGFQHQARKIMENLQNDSSLINYREMKETDIEVLNLTHERSQPAFTCSKSIIETAEQGEVCSKLTIETPGRHHWLWCFLC